MSETTENPIREAIADAIRDHEVILFMKGTPERPACGFSARTVAALDAIGKEFAAVDILPDPRLRHRDRNVRDRRARPGHGRGASGRRAGRGAEGRRAGRAPAPDPE
jgi:hypothetical protein